LATIVFKFSCYHTFPYNPAVVDAVA